MNATYYDWVVERLRKDGKPKARREFVTDVSPIVWGGFRYAARHTKAHARDQARDLNRKGIVAVVRKVEITERVIE